MAHFVDATQDQRFDNFCTVTNPAGLAVGDVMVAFAGGNNASDDISSVPSGWTLIGNTYTLGAFIPLRIYTKTATATDVSDGSTTWSWSSSEWHSVVVDAHRYVVEPADAQCFEAVNGSQGTTLAAPAVTGPGLLLCYGYHNANGGTSRSFPASMTTREDVAQSNAGALLAEESIYGSSSGTRTYTVSPGSSWLRCASVLLVDAPPDDDPSFVAQRGSQGDTTGSGSTAVDMAAAASITVGNTLLAYVAVDNSGTNGAEPGLTVSDPRSNVWTQVGSTVLNDPGNANAGTTLYVYECAVVTNTYTNGDDITFTWGTGSPPAKAIIIEEWTRIGPIAAAASTATGSSTSPSVSSTPTGPRQLMLGVLSVEGPAGDTYTADPDPIEGLWAAVTRLGSGGTTTSAQTIARQYKVVSGTAAQTFNPTITNRDWSVLSVVFEVAGRPSAARNIPVRTGRRGATPRPGTAGASAV